MLGIVVAAHVFLGSIFEGIRTRHRWVMVFGITLMYFGTLENHAEVLYWFNGNMQYLVPLATLLLFLAYLARMATDTGRRNLALAALWGALTVGCNETVLLTVNLVLLAVCTRMFMTADPRRRDFLTLFGVILACSLVAVLAPGNAARDGMTSFAREKDLLLAVYKSLNRSLANTLHWVPVTAVTGLLLTEFVQRKGIRLKPALREIDVRWAALLAGACVIAAYFPNAWARGGANPALRIVDDAQFLFMTGTLLVLFRLADRQSADRSTHWMPAPNPARWLLLTALVCILHSNGRVKRSYTDLLTKAPTYDREMRSRYEAIRRNGGSDTLVLPPLSRIPATVFFRDIRTDPKWWLNIAETRYFKSGVLILRRDNPAGALPSEVSDPTSTPSHVRSPNPAPMRSRRVRKV